MNNQTEYYYPLRWDTSYDAYDNMMWTAKYPIEQEDDDYFELRIEQRLKGNKLVFCETSDYEISPTPRGAWSHPRAAMRDIEQRVNREVNQFRLSQDPQGPQDECQIDLDPPEELENPDEKRNAVVNEFAHVINCYSLENGSDTPDFILAEYLMQCLEAFNMTTKRRTQWYD